LAELRAAEVHLLPEEQLFDYEKRLAEGGVSNLQEDVHVREVQGRHTVQIPPSEDAHEKQ
jgi:hypothetical protein